MAVCKICSKPIEKGKYCKRCKLQKQVKFVERIEKGWQTIKVIAPIVIPIVSGLLGKRKGSSSGDTA